jgi:ABC-type branched-subunit amino acid transport system substrate-binding protein
VALVVGPAGTASFQAARTVLAQAGTPNCVVQVADDALGGARSSFEAGPSNRTEVAALLNALRRAHPDLKKVGLLDEGDELGHSYDAQLTAQAAAAGLAYVGQVVAGAGADQRAALQQLVGQGAQVVVLAQQPATAAAAAQAAGQVGGARPLLAGFGSLADYGFPSLGGDPAVGALVATTTQAYLTDLPRAQWPAGYRDFVSTASRQYGLATDGVQMQATPAGADCLLQWSRAVAQAGTFRGADVTRAWETLDLSSAETALGVRERLTPADHSAVAPDAMSAYTWAREGGRYRLKQVAGPSA